MNWKTKVEVTEVFLTFDNLNAVRGVSPAITLFGFPPQTIL